MISAAELHARLWAVAPIVTGVSIGDPQNKEDWRIDFADAATAEQREAVLAFVANCDIAKIELTAYAAAKRWEIETGGIALPGGVRVATDPVAQTKIAAAKTAFDNGTLTGSIAFKAESGWFSADAAALSSVYAAVVAHVQACYGVEKTVCDGIEAGTVTDTAAIDAAFVL